MVPYFNGKMKVFKRHEVLVVQLQSVHQCQVLRFTALPYERTESTVRDSFERRNSSCNQATRRLTVIPMTHHSILSRNFNARQNRGAVLKVKVRMTVTVEGCATAGGLWRMRLS